MTTAQRLFDTALAQLTAVRTRQVRLLGLGVGGLGGTDAPGSSISTRPPGRWEAAMGIVRDGFGP